MTRVYILRHGNTFDAGDTVTRVGARTDLSLSASGKAQAEAMSAHFAAKGVEFAAIVAGPLKRTLETAEAVQRGQQAGGKMIVAEFLREIDYGPDENQPEENVIARIGEDALRAWEENATPPPGWQVDPQQSRQNWREFFSALAADAPEGPVLVVTSNGVARFALLAAGGDVAERPDLKLKTGAYGTLELDEAGNATLIDWNVRP
ncbi:histidine phosphatase family protein [Henriciella litoralis]|uniref:histidine phosphatase family protein n=1 Tax=Henriciella litoralis TaxID=568102 RepID=UPI0009FF4AFA|nr:histidine phosphatase family protein [Henriciella litoralis]